MKYNELKNTTIADMVKKDRELRNELFQLRIKNRTSQLEKKSKVKMVRRDVARVQTRLTELRNGTTHEEK